MSARGAAALLALAAAACGGGKDASPWALAPETRVSLQVDVREDVAPRGGTRTLSLWLEGRTDHYGVVDTKLRFAAHTIHMDGDPAPRVADTRAVAVQATETSTPDPSMQRVLERMCGHGIRLEFDVAEGSGLRAVTGLDAALADAAPDEGAAEAAARSALSGLAGDRSLRRLLRTAGFDAIPGDAGRPDAAERNVLVFVPGRGETSVRLVGATGRDHDGSPVVRTEGALREGAAFTGDPGPDPPLPVRTAGVKADAETMYDQATRLPMKGNAAVVLPFERGPEMRTRVTFRLTTEK